MTEGFVSNQILTTGTRITPSTKLRAPRSLQEIKMCPGHLRQNSNVGQGKPTMIGTLVPKQFQSVSGTIFNHPKFSPG